MSLGRADGSSSGAGSDDRLRNCRSCWLNGGNLPGALEARKIDGSDGKLTADVTGEVEQEDGVHVMRRVQVYMHLEAGEENRQTIERVHSI
jgi:hypothetical protein